MTVKPEASISSPWSNGAPMEKVFDKVVEVRGASSLSDGLSKEVTGCNSIFREHP